jgi:hypothetical protein
LYILSNNQKKYNPAITAPLTAILKQLNENLSGLSNNNIYSTGEDENLVLNLDGKYRKFLLVGTRA